MEERPATGGREDNAETDVRRGRYPFLRKLLLGFIVISLLNAVFSYMFFTPKMYSINSDNRELVLKYRILQDRIRTLQSKLDEIRQLLVAKTPVRDEKDSGEPIQGLISFT